MKKVVFLLFAISLVFLLASCDMNFAGGGVGDASVTTTTTPSGTSATIVSCVKESSDGLVDTWRITMSDGSSFAVTAENGAAGPQGPQGEAGATGPQGPQGEPGRDGVSPSIVSCVAVGTVDHVTTWRLTFSDGKTTEFTVTNATPMDTGADFLEMLEMLEKMEDALFVERPSMSVGNSTVSDSSATEAGTYKAPTATGAYVTGIGFPMSKNVMFGSADTVYAIRLNRFRVFDREGPKMTEGEFSIEIQIRAYDSTYMALNSKIKKTYTATTVFSKDGDYIDLILEIPRSDFEEFGDDEYFMMLLNLVSSDAKYALRHSKNGSFHHPLTEQTDKGAYLYLGYAQNGVSGGNASNSYEKYTPDIFFSTAMESVPVDLSGLIGSGNAGNEGGSNVPELNTDHLLQLPEVFDLVVGDTFEMYYKGITLSLNVDDFAYELSYSDGKNRGNNYTSKYIWTPTAADVGVHTLSIAIRDNYGRILDEGTVKLNVVPKPVSPAGERTYLFIGASTVEPGTYPKEVIRRLTSTAGTKTEGGVIFPAGDGLTGIKTIGSVRSDKGLGDVLYEGYGGWSASSYTTAYTQRPYFAYIIGDYAGVAISQHSHYTDGNGQLWKVESVTDTKIKLIAVKEAGGNIDTSCKGLNVGADGKIPASGSLTFVTGNTADVKTLSYSATEKAEGNPFWNTELGRNDFISYAEKQGVEKIDEVIIILGWNSTTTDSIERENAMRKLVEDILRDFPDCHVTLCGLQGPSRDGFGANYGISWNYYEKLEAMFDMQKAYMKIAGDEKYDGHVSFVHVSGQFDADHNYGTEKVPTNNRNPATVDREYNGLHPSTIGYYQIADAVYRHLVTRLQPEG